VESSGSQWSENDTHWIPVLPQIKFLWTCLQFNSNSIGLLQFILGWMTAHRRMIQDSFKIHAGIQWIKSRVHAVERCVCICLALGIYSELPTISARKFLPCSYLSAYDGFQWRLRLMSSRPQPSILFAVIIFWNQHRDARNIYIPRGPCIFPACLAVSLKQWVRSITRV
jgi:hypothetical protein